MKIPIKPHPDCTELSCAGKLIGLVQQDDGTFIIKFEYDGKEESMRVEIEEDIGVNFLYRGDCVDLFFDLYTEPEELE
jgi:hypothetical protein